MSGFSTIRDTKFDHLVKVLTARSLHCKAMLFPLQLASNLWADTLALYKYS